MIKESTRVTTVGSSILQKVRFNCSGGKAALKPLDWQLRFIFLVRIYPWPNKFRIEARSSRSNKHRNRKSFGPTRNNEFQVQLLGLRPKTSQQRPKNEVSTGKPNLNFREPAFPSLESGRIFGRTEKFWRQIFFQLLFIDLTSHASNQTLEGAANIFRTSILPKQIFTINIQSKLI